MAPVAGWAPSSVRTVLTRSIYRGLIEWNRSRKRTDWGNVDQKPRPESDWTRVSAEQLRIIPEDLWVAVASRRKDTEGRTLRFDSGRLSDRPPKYAIKNLLAGLATCGVCGGGLIVETSSTRRGGPRIAHYVCHRHRHNGTCKNIVKVTVAEMNEAVLQAVEAHALTPEAIEQVIQLTERDDLRDQQTKLEREQKDVEKRIKRLVEAIETGGDVPSLVAKVRELEARRADIGRQVASLQPVPRLPKKVIEDRLTEWRRLLRQSITQGRAVLQRVLQGRITFTPRADGQAYDFSGPTRFDKLFTGIAVERPAFLPKGGGPNIRPEDTLDVDYGELLERACGNGKGVASHLDMNPP